MVAPVLSGTLLISQIFGVVTPVFAIVALGFLWAKWKQPFDTETLTNLVVKVATPCLVFTTLTRLNVQLEDIGQMILSACLALAMSALLGAIILKLSSLPYHTYLASLMHPNTGNIGLPLAFVAFGDEGLALGVAYFIAISISQYTIGYGLTAGTISVRRLLRQPLLYAVFISISTLAFGLPVPQWIAKTTELVSGLVIPGLLLVLGYSLSQLKITDLRLALYIAISRLLIGVVVGFTVLIVLDLQGPAAGVVFLMCMMPIAVFNFVFAKHFNRSPEKVAGIIVTSTLLVFLFLPFFVWVAIHLAEGRPVPGFTF